MGGRDYTIAERQHDFHRRKKAAGFKMVREYVPADLADALKAIAEEMRDPEKADGYREWFAALTK